MTTSTFGVQTDAPTDLPMRPRGARRAAAADDYLFQEPAAPAADDYLFQEPADVRVDVPAVPEAPAESWAEAALQSLTAEISQHNHATLQGAEPDLPEVFVPEPQSAAPDLPEVFVPEPEPQPAVEVFVPAPEHESVPAIPEVPEPREPDLPEVFVPEPEPDAELFVPAPEHESAPAIPEVPGAEPEPDLSEASVPEPAPVPVPAPVETGLKADIPGGEAARAARTAADAAARDLGLSAKSAELLHCLLVLSATDLSRGYPWRVHNMTARDWYEGFLFEDASSWLSGVGEAFSMRAFRTAMSGAEALAAFNSLSLLCLTPGVREETRAGVQALLADPPRITRVLRDAGI